MHRKPILASPCAFQLFALFIVFFIADSPLIARRSSRSANTTISHSATATAALLVFYCGDVCCAACAVILAACCHTGEKSPMGSG